MAEKYTSTRKIQGVADSDGNVKCRIVERSFRSLHPVDDAFGVWRRGSGAADQDPWIISYFTQRLRDFMVCCLGIHRREVGCCRGQRSPVKALRTKGAA